MSGLHLIFRIRSVCAALLLLATAASGHAAPGRVTARPSAQSPVWTGRTPPQNIQFQSLPLERSRQNHLLLRARINGKPALLGIDSGAPVSAIAINRVKHFGLTDVGATSELPRRLRINGGYNSVAIAQSLQLGALDLVDEPMVAIDLGGSSRAAKLMNEQAIDGIIGADILFPTEAVLDCRKQILTLKVDPDVRGRAPGTDYSGFTKVPMYLSAGYNLYVDSGVNGTRARLMVDSGAFSTLLHRRFVRQMKIAVRDTALTSAGVNIKRRGVQLATISRLSIGGVELRKREVGVIDLEGLIRSELLNAKPPVVGLLGSEILQRYNGIIDFGTKTLYLKH
ncbi:MAG: aspartyl protease family protein [Chthoniobacterales bacterium]|nr:aspartyl protease family protein [Chthoniobacterales bacterium]